MNDSNVEYSPVLSPQRQIDTEEQIASLLFHHPEVETNVEAAADLGRSILYVVLREFRADLFEDYKP